jgi:hypothetical protein
MAEPPDTVSAAEEAPQRPGRAARAAAFDFLCQALSAGPVQPTPGAHDPDWVALVEQANRERVVSQLYATFEARGWPADSPQDLRDYLALVYQANAEQNRAIRKQALETAEILNRAGAGFVFLKGANWLLEAPEDRIGERWLADIDLAIAPRDWDTALAAIEAAGYREAADPVVYQKHFHHTPLAREGDRVTIELHRHLGWQRHLLTTDEVVAAAQPLPAFPQARLCSPMHRFIYGCLHAQLQNMEYAAGQFSLRDLCDIQYLLATRRAELDWPEIADLAQARGIFAYLAASLHLAHRLLGLEIPEPFAASRRARAHASRCLMQHRGNLRPRLTGFAIKLAWLMDSRRLAYELDCEKAPWLLRQPLIAGGRIASVLRRVAYGRRDVTGSPVTAELPPEELPTAES